VAGDSSTGGRLDALCSFGDGDPFLVEGSARGVTFGDEGADFLEGRFTGSVPIISYTAARLVEPHGTDLVGLHPREVQDLTTTAFFYLYRLVDVDYSEAALSGYDSQEQSHTVIVPFLAYSWLDGECGGVTDYEAETGLFFIPLSMSSSDQRSVHTSYDPSFAGWSVDSAFTKEPSLLLCLGWRRMAEFTGPVVDPNPKVTSFAGVVTGSYGPFAIAFKRMPGPSLVSNYQIDTSVEFGFAAKDSDFSVRAKVGHDRADRSLGPDVSLWKADAGVDLRLGHLWQLSLDLGWRERSSTAGGEDYDVFTAFLGLAWGSL